MSNGIKKITLSAVLAGFALISFMIENLFPPIFIPGARMGVSNIFILFAFLSVGTPYAFAVLLIKTVLGSIIIGTPSAILYSLPAGIISLAFECILLRSGFFGLIAVSSFGGVINLTIQNIIFCLISGTSEFLAYLPYLSIIGAVAGIVVGSAVFLITKFLPEKYFYIKDKNNSTEAL